MPGSNKAAGKPSRRGLFALFGGGAVAAAYPAAKDAGAVADVTKAPSVVGRSEPAGYLRFVCNGVVQEIAYYARDDERGA